MLKTTTRGLLDSYRKNKDDLRALLLGTYPEFIYKPVHTIRRGHIPVFVFHSVDAKFLDSQLRHLADNNYRTLTADQLHDALVGQREPKENAIALTFDDGRGSLWSVAYPLLKKYDLSAISFIVPFYIRDSSQYNPNLEDVWNGTAALSDIHARELKTPLCTWDEIQKMHESGVIDFQSHTSHHHSVFVSNRLVDFIRPSLQTSYLHSTLNPVIRMNGQDVFPDRLEWGHPIYQWAPALSATTRYIEDGNLSRACIHFVRENGGRKFFRQAGWRQTLRAHMLDVARTNGRTDRFQALDERAGEIRRDLVESKQLIERKLDKVVRHLCYPWYSGSDLALQMSKEAGYCSNYWGIVGREAINRVGGNPYRIARITDDYIVCLPGKGRMRLYEALMSKVRRVVERRLSNSTGN